MGQYTEYLAVLERETACCEALLAKSREKKEALIHNDVAAIEAITAVEADLIQSMSEAEQERLAQTRRIAEKLGRSPESLTISAMIELMDGPEEAELIRLRDALGGILEEQQRLNELNRSLIETQLSYIDYMINATTAPETLNNSYTASGSAPEPDERLKFIDHQI